MKKVLEPAKGKVTFLNDSRRSVRIQTYDENDFFRWIPYQTLTLAPDAVARLVAPLNIMTMARGEKFINVYVDDVLFKPCLGKSYIYNGIDLIKQS